MKSLGCDLLIQIKIGDSKMQEHRIIEKLDSILSLLKGEQPSDGYMDISQLQQYCSMSKSSIRRACAEGRLKYNDSQGKHLYKRSSVEEWLSNG